jgi:carboxymethylenebutenolidase
MQVTTTAVDVPTPDGVADAVLAAPDDDGRHPAVLLFMDAFGLRPQLAAMAGRIAAEGYVVLVPNLFHRSGRAPVVELPDLSDPAARAAAFELLMPHMRALTPTLAVRDADAYLAYLEHHPRVADGPVATVGYCMGGGLALRTAALAADRVAAAASFHGGRLATDQPDSPHLGLGQVRAEVYVAHADDDPSMPPDQQQRLAEALDAAGVRHRVELYEGARHGFTMADTPAFDAAAAERHWNRLSDLLARTLPA